MLHPLLMGDALGQSVAPAAPPTDPSRNQAIDALREIEFDRATGTLSEPDYDALKAVYTQRAIDAMRSAESGTVCQRCGPRPEAGARFCSKCGAGINALRSWRRERN
ncbi:MAG: hypothetical protein Q7S20_13580 [Gemmatimonadaceae bacterium]|nr:hypothetical protein [Gemmatimonadaceae bacterium]